MSQIIHLKPPIIYSDYLFPLNVLKKEYPEIDKQEVKKYRGREGLTQVVIPKLNCLWNDV